MKLIGMLDSPYVRRVAISLQLLGLPFEHRSLSVFRTFDQFRAINAVVKAPTLVCDDGTVLMDSTLILDYAEALAAPRSLMPRSLADRQAALRTVGLALAACEKSVQLVYENLRPADKRHQPWVERVTAQLQAALGALEAELAQRPRPAAAQRIGAAEVATAVAWYFNEHMQPGTLQDAKYPRLRELSAWAEQLPEFVAAPHGDCIVQPRS
ncbi:MAG TPA: glutathione S-transferase family protein [Steroidobacteraceae bacterium]|jgi:glutathione S-transferase|nr:glutathione S-transferase family protein [Steroidobacteraceae bacterium]